MNTIELRQSVLRILSLLNFTMVIFLSIVSSVTIYKISGTMQARAFLEKASSLPRVPWTIPVISIGVFVFLITTMYLCRCMSFPTWLVIIIQLVCGIIIMMSLDMNYNGVFLLVTANMLDLLKNDGKKLRLIAAFGVSLLIFDFQFCQRFMNITSFEVYLEYYRNISASALLAVKNGMTAINIIIFIIYTILLLGEQVDENEKIYELNQKLNLTNIELKHANEELANYASESERIAQTKERNRLAREIHDTLGHTLTGIIAALDAAIAILPISVDQTKLQLEMIRDVARQGMTDVRRSVSALRPDVLEREDLLSAITQTISEATSTANVEIDFINEIDVLKFNEDEEDIIYRIIQEGITNSIRHGKANHISISLRKEFSIITLKIHDDGIGTDNVKYGFGLTHMKERLDMLGGELLITGNDGFTILATIPIRWGEDND